MSNPYPYIQTLRDFDESIKSYAMQLAENIAKENIEDDPVLAFGPVGKINIFVGATNAGKSRFLRTIGKCKKYEFLTEEFHHQIDIINAALKYLMDSGESIEFKIKQTLRYHSGQPHAIVDMPSWFVNALDGIRPEENYQETFNAKYFQEFNAIFVAFIKFKLDSSIDRKADQRFKVVRDEVIIGDFEIGSWAKNILKGELEQRDKDAELNPNSYRYNPKSLKHHPSQCLSFPIDSVSKNWQKNFILLWESFNAIKSMEAFILETPPERIYIPTLRSAVSLSDDEGKRLQYDIFKETVVNNYNLQETGLDIFTGNQLYDTLSEDSRGTWEVIDRFHEFEQFLGEAFYDGNKVEIVARSSKYDPRAGQHIVIRVGKETPRELHDLGDGINTLIILIYKLFMATPGSWIFIEEPELNLHPGLQRVFLQTLLENEVLQKRNIRVFFTTHSNHLLRMTMRDGSIASNNISVFAFQQRETNKDRFLIRPLISEHHEALTLLGVQNASVLLAQCGIWVEGHTDRKYLRAYLNAYQESEEFRKLELPKMREDTHFAFWEYAGSNLDHYLLSDIPRKGTPEAIEYEQGRKQILDDIQSSALCNRIFLLADQDRRKGEKHATLTALAEGRSNFEYVYTRCIEIENVLSGKELSAALPSFLKRSPRQIPSLNENDYKNIRIGEFLSQKFSEQHFPASWREKSGTLSTPKKKRLCDLVVGQIKWTTMSSEAKRITKLLYEFVYRHNNI